jgi:hypothetical protein
MKALIDGDIICYSCGFASEKVMWEYKGQRYEKKTDISKDAKATDIHRVAVAEPKAHALHTAKQFIASILKETKALVYVIYLTGENNYRDRVATDYKGNRDGAPKPVHYQAIRDYLINNHGARVVNGIEADDAMGIEQYDHWKRNPYRHETIICSIDKDMDMVPGLHYRWEIRRGGKVVKPSKVYDVTMTDADRFFFWQLLVGDTVDNIKGCAGIGPKKADAILAACVGRREMECAVGFQYALKYDDPEAEMIKNWKLLWILRELPKNATRVTVEK